MMRPRAARLLLVLSLLGSAATAHAECAWVFWLEVSGPPTHESSSRPVSGWGTREACEQALTQKLGADSEKDTNMDVTVDPQAGRPRLWVRRKGHPEPLAVYLCLPPDTVDPRGRGKWRQRPVRIRLTGSRVGSIEFERRGGRCRVGGCGIRCFCVGSNDGFRRRFSASGPGFMLAVSEYEIPNASQFSVTKVVTVSGSRAPHVISRIA